MRQRTLQKLKLTEWEINICIHGSDKGLVTHIYKGLLQLNTKKTTQLENEQRI